MGTLVSSMIQIFISEERLTKIIPKNKVIGILCAALVGFIFPVCDCAIVPIARRLIKKGMPLYIAITFMLSVPIINPIVLSSTYYAFSNNIHIVILRAGLGILGAIIVGSIVGMADDTSHIFKKAYMMENSEHHQEETCECGHHHHHEHNEHNNKLFEILEHTSMEIHDVGRFLILGAFLSATMQTIIPRRYILMVGQHNIYSVLVMILLAFILAVCSETDAFIAKTFGGQFTSGSIIAFLIFGPMIDIKNTMMLSSTFKFTFVLKLIFVIFLVCLLIGIGANVLVLKGVVLW
jgi:uncharacterized membrane protein YraQ (UPF0718 family)